MKGVSTLALAAGILITGSNAIQLVKKDAAPAVVGLSIGRRSVVDPVKRDQLRRRQNSKTVSETLDNFEVTHSVFRQTSQDLTRSRKVVCILPMSRSVRQHRTFVYTSTLAAVIYG